MCGAPSLSSDLRFDPSFPAYQPQGTGTSLSSWHMPDSFPALPFSLLAIDKGTKESFKLFKLRI